MESFTFLLGLTGKSPGPVILPSVWPDPHGSESTGLRKDRPKCGCFWGLGRVLSFQIAFMACGSNELHSFQKGDHRRTLASSIVLALVFGSVCMVFQRWAYLQL
jgi:hypothetical protein